MLAAAAELRRRGEADFYGFSIAKRIQEREGARRLVAYGTLYKALDRLEQAGLLVSHWEDPPVAAAELRPRRRLYRLTALGGQALVDALASRAVPASGLDGLAPS
ncbi:MAG: PadR family transcriptional regulator [Actinomycetota bacterium]